MGQKTQGRRLPDVEEGILPGSLDDLQEGDYWLIKDPDCGYSPGPENLIGLLLGIWPPKVGGVAVLYLHTVREEEDGTVSVRYGDGSSNSILVSNASASWHGFIEHGVWEEC